MSPGPLNVTMAYRAQIHELAELRAELAKEKERADKAESYLAASDLAKENSTIRAECERMKTLAISNLQCAGDQNKRLHELAATLAEREAELANEREVNRQLADQIANAVDNATHLDAVIRERESEIEELSKMLGKGPYVPLHQYENVCKQREDEIAKRREREAEIERLKATWEKSKDQIMQVWSELEMWKTDAIKLFEAMRMMDDELEKK